METPIYQESQTMPTWFALLICLLGVAAILCVFLTASEKEFGFAVLALFLCFAILALFLQMKVVITTSDVSFGFAIWRKRVALRDIEILGIEPIPVLAGFGIHYYGGKWVYNASFKGQGVHLVYQGKKHYLIGSNHPEALLSALKTATATR
jgi:hypothetical protein